MENKKQLRLEAIASICDDPPSGKVELKRYNSRIKNIKTEVIVADLEKIRQKQGYLSSCDLAEYLDSYRPASIYSSGEKPSTEMYDQDSSMFG